jgi:hypothetical protein
MPKAKPKKQVAIYARVSTDNASNTGMAGIREFIDYVKDQPNFKTAIDRTSSAGISISYKTAEK